MIVIRARNAHSALPAAVLELVGNGVRRESRNGPVVMAREPVTFVFERPLERVVFWPERDANPFFSLAESLWMLAGRDDVEFPAYFVPRMRNYSDDGATLHGAYGYRWRVAQGFDQLGAIISGLRADQSCRRQVLQIWEARKDLRGQEGRKDIPCNIAATVQINTDGALDLTVLQRSGDLVWGALGANPPQFAFLLEYLAGRVGVPVGVHRHVVSNLHAYLSTFEAVKPLVRERPADYPAPPFSLGVVPGGAPEWDEDCHRFCRWETLRPGAAPFFRVVAWPLRDAYRAFRSGSRPQAFYDARKIVHTMTTCDWRTAAQDWLDRREANWRNKQGQEG